MSYKGLFPFLLAVVLLTGTCFSESIHPGKSPSARASLSARSSKTGHPLELIVTVRGVGHPKIDSIDRPASIRMHLLRAPQFLTDVQGGVWLFRYKITPTLSGDFEIPPIQVSDSGKSFTTKPLWLHVSDKGELPSLSSRELAAGIEISETLSNEVMKNVPKPTPKPTPSPTPPDARPLHQRVAGTVWKELKAYWNYPGSK
jgi:hypothetical protein